MVYPLVGAGGEVGGPAGYTYAGVVVRVEAMVDTARSFWEPKTGHEPGGPGPIRQRTGGVACPVAQYPISPPSRASARTTHLTDTSPAVRAITLRHLLTSTSGYGMVLTACPL